MRPEGIGDFEGNPAWGPVNRQGITMMRGNAFAASITQAAPPHVSASRASSTGAGREIVNTSIGRAPSR